MQTNFTTNNNSQNGCIFFIRQDGSLILQDGSLKLQDGSHMLQDESLKLQNGSHMLQDGSLKLQDGSHMLQDGASNLGYVNDEHSVVISEESRDNIKEVKTEIEDDPWKISDVYVEVVPWSELNACGKVQRVLWDYFGKAVLLVGFLYLFICSLDFLSDAFRLVGGKAAGSVFSESEILSNPVAGLMIGILATVLLQSSSTTTSIVVSMVAAKIIPIQNAIPMVMGANIGTSITNTLVSIGQITNKNDFRRAFAGATVHDMFNWLTVLILLPVEVVSGYLFHISDWMVKSMHLTTNEEADQEFLHHLTHPFTKLIIQVDKQVIQDVAHGKPEAMNKSFVKHCCLKGKRVVERWNATGNSSYNATETICLEKCRFIFESVTNTWSDTTIGIVLLVIALVILCACLVCIVKTLNALLKGKVSVLIRKFVNADFPGKLAYFTDYLAIVFGTGLTILVQSSSVFTSAMTPLVGIGVISIDRMYPLTLGSNIGTTTTAILAALAQEADAIPLALQISLCHLFFNLTGIVLFFPIPYLRFPISMAKFLGNQTAKYRWFAIVYLILLFFLLPAAIFALSVVSWKVMVGVLGPIILFLLIILFINILQRKAPLCLPRTLRSWRFLPDPLRSLKPIDRQISKLTICCPCCKSKDTKDDDDVSSITTQENTKL